MELRNIEQKCILGFKHDKEKQSSVHEKPKKSNLPQNLTKYITSIHVSRLHLKIS